MFAPWTWCVFFGVLYWNAWWRVSLYITCYVRVWLWLPYGSSLSTVLLWDSLCTYILLHLLLVYYMFMKYLYHYVMLLCFVDSCCCCRRCRASTEPARDPRLHQVEEKKKAEEEAKKVHVFIHGYGVLSSLVHLQAYLGKSAGLAPKSYFCWWHLALVLLLILNILNVICEIYFDYGLLME